MHSVPTAVRKICELTRTKSYLWLIIVIKQIHFKLLTAALQPWAHINRKSFKRHICNYKQNRFWSLCEVYVIQQWTETSLQSGLLLVSNVPGGRRVFTSLLVVVPHEGRGGRGTRPVVNKTLVRTRHVHVAACARLIVSVGLACAVADAVAASTNDDSRRWRGIHQATVERNRVDDVTS